MGTLRAAAVWLLGLSLGSFLNVLTIRLATGASLAAARSSCPACRQVLRWYELIPVASFVALGGRCRRCRAPISWQYPLLELAAAAVFSATYFAFADAGAGLLLRNLVFALGGLALFVFDLRWYVVPDVVSLPLIAAGVLMNVVLGTPPGAILLGLAVGGGFYGLLWAASRGRWVGSGDVRLGLVLGAFLGYPDTLVALYLAYLTGAAVAGWLLLTGRRSLGSRLPMGTFLMAAGWLTLFFGRAVAAWFSGA